MYATVDDMIARFGEPQMIRLSTPDDLDATVVDATKVETALTDATALIESYVRGRYFVPIATPPSEIVRACCQLARYDLADGERTRPTEEMSKQRSDVISWLRGIADEKIHLDLPAADALGPTVNSGPRMADRRTVFSDRSMRDF
ncbi:gp436 family protein [Rhizobium mayense]|uniref:DUF1320 domain-containing protein n=1 Tax=Rhizobium mayense TaxID=1312184 RepID=A0ABT7JZS8_9HYPH|nr:DUF1320 domain-containing protein [Rhizobium mayense]MDL2401255.1 DUF1320 domain-containing protein [Rhizobium mayense]